MKTIILAFLLIFLLVLPLTAAPPHQGKLPGSMAASFDNSQFINANNLLMFVTNQGSFGRDLGGVFGHDYGVYYPYTSIAAIDDGSNISSVIFASGLWIGAIDSATSETRVAIAEYSQEYKQGPYSAAASGALVDDTAYHVYKIYSDSTASNPNSDWTNWPVSQGAPVDSNGDPLLIGDQTLWSVYSDGDTAQHANDAGNTKPLGIEVRQTTFAFNRTDPLGNIAFLKLQIFNKGPNVLQNCYFSLWCDPDLGGFTDDLDGCDTLLSLGYCYNATNNDESYGSTPPAVGYDFFQGPLIPSVGDTAKMWGTTWPDFKNMPMTSFNKYINGTDPQSNFETYNYMQGLTSGGSPLANGTKFAFPGDPVAGTGDLDFDPADRRFMLTTGPITFRPGDSTEILAAIIVGRGGDRLSSISVLKYFDRFAQSAYDVDFQLKQAPAAPQVVAHELKGEISLDWSKISETDQGDYPFEGYTVYQGESPSGPWKQLANFDIVNGTANILDDVLDPETGVLEIRAVKIASDNGLQRYYGTSEDALLGGSIKNLTDYYFKVEAYSYDPNESPKTLTSATIVTINPQNPLADTDYDLGFGDTLSVTHVSGLSDGAVIPYIIDPSNLTGHDYEVVFGDDSTLGPVWHLVDVTINDTLLANQTNQTGDEDYAIVDGMLIKVTGPPVPGMKDWDVPNGTRRFTWANADGFGWEGFQGAIGWGGPGDVNGFGTNNPVPPSEHVSVLLKLAKVDTLDGSDSLGSFSFDPNDPNVSYAYRYLRSPGPPAQPEFGPYIVDPNPPGGSYGFQDFAQSVPLSAWNIDVNPPQRLAVGFLENNQINGRVDGKWFPGSYSNYDNIASDGPREWLWIFKADYSTTPNPAYQLNAIDDPMPVLWWLTVNRRGVVPFSPGSSGDDEFLIISNHVNTSNDLFTFTATAPKSLTQNEDALANIKAVPNPYYLFSSYDNSVFNRVIKFNNLPDKCTIRIFNLGGDLIKTIEKDDATTSTAEWNVQTENQLPIASGIYIYIVEAPGFGEKVGKLAIFTEVEVLKRF